ncbi:hypothetical protein DNTS_013991, partial [Danionella cerebrum]
KSKVKDPPGTDEGSSEAVIYYLSIYLFVSAHPEYLFPLVLTSVTQELFGCRADEDVTAENPYKLLKKEEIIQDMKNRAAVCDFSPVKQTVLDYPEEELLLVFDRDFTYGQSFYLVLTVQAKESILKVFTGTREGGVTTDGEEALEHQEEEEVMPKTPEPHPWVSLGSEMEIEEELLIPSRARSFIGFGLVHENDQSLTVATCVFGSGVMAVSMMERASLEERIESSTRLLLNPSCILFWSFSDPIHPQLQLECPDDILCFQFCPSDPNILAAGCVNGQIKTSMIPVVRYCAVSGIEHGHKAPITDLQWLPETFEVSRLGLPVENSSGMSVQLVSCAPDCCVLFWDLRLPRVVSRSMTDVRQKSVDKPLENPHGVPNTFKHLNLTWKPFIRVSLPKMGSSGEYSPLRLSMRENTLDYSTDQSRSEAGPLWIPPPRILMRITHRGSIGDGQSQKKKLCSVPLSLSRGGGKAAQEGERKEGCGFSQLRVPSAKQPKVLENISTKLYVGTEDGELVYVDWKVEKDGDSGRLLSSKPLHQLLLQDSQVRTISRSPFFRDILLVVSSFSFSIWKEGLTIGPLIRSPYSKAMCTAGHWSQSRPAVFFIGKEDGNIDIYDLLQNTHEATQSQSICTAAVTCIRTSLLSSKQHLLAVSDHLGTLHILQIPWTLRKATSSERQNVQKYLEKEQERLMYFEKRQENHEKEKKEMDAELKRKKMEVLVPLKQLDVLEAEALKEYEQYVAMEKLLLKSLGVRRESEEAPEL